MFSSVISSFYLCIYSNCFNILDYSRAVVLTMLSVLIQISSNAWTCKPIELWISSTQWGHQAPLDFSPSSSKWETENWLSWWYFLLSFHFHLKRVVVNWLRTHFDWHSPWKWSILMSKSHASVLFRVIIFPQSLNSSSERGLLAKDQEQFFQLN